MPQTRNQTAARSKAANGTETAETSGASKESTGPEQSGLSSEAEPPRRESPDNCSICLGPFTDKSFTNSCAHSFCFVCLKQWSKVKAECPLCKQPFFRIFHNIRSNQLYDTYELPRPPTPQVNPYNFYDYVGSGLSTFTMPPHYLSLTQPFDADLTLSNFSRFQFRHRRYDRYLNPLSSIQGEHPYSYPTGPSVDPTIHVSGASWPRGPEDFRREVYRRYLGPPAVILGNENSTYRLTPAMVAASSHRLHRIMPWLTRELRVLLRNMDSILLAISMIQPLLTQVPISSNYFHDRVATLIGRHSRTFMQEFVAFANSALTMQAFDRKAMYRRRDEIAARSSPGSSSSSENDVVEITDVSPEPTNNNTIPDTQAQASQPLDLRRVGWDSPTPGPSWSNWDAQTVPIDRVSVSSESDDPVFIPNMRNSDSDTNSRVGSDIVFVKYDKPWEERSPINLTSDSEKETEPEPTKKKKKSKHKKKRMHTLEKTHVSGENGNKHSSKSKSHSSEKSKNTQKGETGEERNLDGSHKRHHSLSSPETVRKKKHKKSRDKKDKSSDSNRDRELVDRLFAEAFAQQKGNASVAEEKSGERPRQRKDKERSGRSSTKDRNKKKKKSKSKSHTRVSRSPSYSQMFKKHHSGHKKSSNTVHSVHTSCDREQLNNHSRASPAAIDHTSVASSSHPLPQEDSSELTVQPLNHSSLLHSNPRGAPPSGFQPPYLPPPDTVQHIPVNLWVSTWSAMPVSQNFPPSHLHPSSSSNQPPVISQANTVPQTSGSSFSSTASTRGVPGVSTLDSQTISSESSSSDCDYETAQDRQVPSFPSLKSVDSHTMQWLETHCPNLGKLQPAVTTSASSSTSAVAVIDFNTGTIQHDTARSMSSSSSNYSSSSSSSEEGANVSSGTTQRPNCQVIATQAATKENNTLLNVEVVSIGSGDEDVVICSSTDDSDSDVHCLEEPINVGANCSVVTSLSTLRNKEVEMQKKKSSQNVPPVSLAPGFISSTLLDVPDSGGLILPSGHKTFQPFKVQSKPALAHKDKDPFFSTISHSSDEGEHNSSLLENLLPDISTVPHSLTDILSVDTSIPATNSNTASSTAPENSSGTPKATTHSAIYLSGIDINPEHENKSASSLSGALSHNATETTQPTATYKFTSAAATSSIFSVLPSLPHTSTSITSMMSQSHNYLPYFTIPTACTTSPPVLPPPLPFSTPSPSVANLPSLLNFSFPPPVTQSTGVQNDSILPSLFQASVNQILATPEDMPSAPTTEISPSITLNDIVSAPSSTELTSTSSVISNENIPESIASLAAVTDCPTGGPSNVDPSLPIAKPNNAEIPVSEKYDTSFPVSSSSTTDNLNLNLDGFGSEIISDNPAKDQPDPVDNVASISDESPHDLCNDLTNDTVESMSDENHLDSCVLDSQAVPEINAIDASTSFCMISNKGDGSKEIVMENESLAGLPISVPIEFPVNSRQNELTSISMHDYLMESEEETLPSNEFQSFDHLDTIINDNDKNNIDDYDSNPEDTAVESEKLSQS